jgi:fibro-slime domain-containing protein
MFINKLCQKVIISFLLLVVSGFSFSGIPDVAGHTVYVQSPWSRLPGMLIQNGYYSMTHEGGDWWSYTFDGTENIWGGFFFTAMDMNGNANYEQLISQDGYGSQAVIGTQNDDRFGEIFGTSEHAYITFDPETHVPEISFAAPRYLNILNPQDWNLSAPTINVNGVSLSMETLPEHCGWFSYMFIEGDEPQAVFLEDIFAQEPFGQYGYGDITPWNISEAFDSYGDTVWLIPEENLLFGEDPMWEGECSYELKAVVRDFSEAHPDFYTSANESSCEGLQRGRVEYVLGADGTPIRSAGDTCTQNFEEWFHDVPDVNHGACVDIPMGKTGEGHWEYNSLNEPSANFVPIDDFNNFNETYTSCYVEPRNESELDLMNPEDVGGDSFNWYTDAAYSRNGLHNFHFCMETHADFIYKTGQTFFVRGDDDIWVYINNQLVIDLGGMHVPLPSGVDLDTLGLIDGQRYSFDLFMCERIPCGSNLKINSSLYLEQRSGLTYSQTGDTYEFFQIEGGTCGLQGSGEEVIIPGSELNLTYTLVTSIGDSISSASQGVDNGSLAPGGVYFGGIDLSFSGIVSLNENLFSGLAPGRYRLIVRDVSDESLMETIPFSVVGNLSIDTTAMARVIAAAPAVENVAGALVPLYVKNGADEFIDETDMGYSLVFPPELLVYTDSNGVYPVGGGDVLNTGNDGIDTLWVTGSRYVDEEQMVNINIRNSRGPGVDLMFRIPQLRWVESMEQPVVPLTDPAAEWEEALVPLTLYIGAYTDQWGQCGNCFDTLRVMDADEVLRFFDAYGNPIAPGYGFVMENGFSELRVMALGRVQNASFTIQGASQLTMISLNGIDLEGDIWDSGIQEYGAVKVNIGYQNDIIRISGQVPVNKASLYALNGKVLMEKMNPGKNFQMHIDPNNSVMILRLESGSHKKIYLLKNSDK